MKRNIFMISIIFLLSIFLNGNIVYAACSQCTGQNHEACTGSYKYTSNNSSTHKITCCDGVAIFGYEVAHTFSNNVCTACGYNKSSGSGGTTGTITGEIVSWNHTNNGIVNMTVTATSTSGMRYVRFPTWSDAADSSGNNQDDIVWYQVDGAGPTYTISIDLKKHSPGTTGLYHIHVYGYRVGSSTGVMLGGVNVYYDTTAPSAPTITTKYADGTTYTSGSWANKRVNVTLSSTDSASGISKYQYKYGSGSWTDLSDNTDYFEAERNQTIYYRAVDKAGNISNESNFIMRMDTTAPSAPTITTKYADGTTYTSGNWANKRVNVTLSSTDSASGISKYQYKYGSGSWTDLSNNTDYFAAERNQTIYYRAVDKAGNTSSATSFKICIDTTAPTSTLITSPTIYTKTSTVTITINATDGFSGMNNVNFMIWSETLGKEESIYSEILTSTDGTYTLNLDLTKKFSETTGKFYVVPYISDKALNTSWGTQTTIYYDITKPTVDSVTFPKYVTSPTFTASATASDIGGSGLYRVGFAAYPAGGDGGKAAWDNDTASPYSVTVDLTETVTGGTEGKYNLHVYAYDNAGNTSTVKAQTLIYDKTAPTVTVAEINHGSNASIKLLDSTSGITHWAVTTTTAVPTNTHSSNATTGSTGGLWYPITNTTSETTVTFSGLKVGTYYAWGKDAAGNTKYTQFKVKDVTKPTGNLTSASTVYTKSSSVTVKVTAQDETGGSGIDYVTFPTRSAVEDSTGNPQDDIVWHKGTQTGTSTEYTFTVDLTKHTPGTDGKYYIHPYAYDKAGNGKQLGSVTIYYDTTAPTGSWSNSSKIYTKETSHAISINASDDLSGIKEYTYQFWYGSEIVETITSTSNSYTVNLSKGEGTYAVIGSVTDKAGNVYTLPTNKTYVYDIKAPVVNSATVPKYVTSTSFDVSATASDTGGSGLYWVGFAAYPAGGDGGKAAWDYDTTSPYSATIDLTETVTGGTEGKYNLHVYAYDNAGNRSEVKAQTLIYDKTAPTGTVNINAKYENNGAKYVDSNKINIDFGVEDNYSNDAGIKMAILNEDEFNSITSDSGIEWMDFAETIEWQTTAGDGLKKIYVIFKDEVGNQSLYLAK